jgi:hypothetical protein
LQRIDHPWCCFGWEQLARSTAGTDERESQELLKVLAEQVDAFGPRPRVSTLLFYVRFDHGLPDAVRGDRDRIGRR